MTVLELMLLAAGLLLVTAVTLQLVGASRARRRRKRLRREAWLMREAARKLQVIR